MSNSDPSAQSVLKSAQDAAAVYDDLIEYYVESPTSSTACTSAEPSRDESFKKLFGAERLCRRPYGFDADRQEKLPLADFFGEAFPLVGVMLKLFERATESRMPALERHFIRRMSILEFFQYFA